ncbi:hypothetical protein AB0F45_36750, partial [Streptomyces achromogenes]|uniref:hypothetical protein n=1 Tax=Streptomyces achromogenes TaxID=67255 RepID=UPI0033F89F93
MSAARGGSIMVPVGRSGSIPGAARECSAGPPSCRRATRPSPVVFRGCVRWRPRPKGGWRESGDPAEIGGLLYDLGS